MMLAHLPHAAWSAAAANAAGPDAWETPAGF